jgi:hypothetical protein
MSLLILLLCYFLHQPLQFLFDEKVGVGLCHSNYLFVRSIILQINPLVLQFTVKETVVQVQSEDLVSNIRWFSPNGDLIPQDERYTVLASHKNSFDE